MCGGSYRVRENVSQQTKEVVKEQEKQVHDESTLGIGAKPDDGMTVTKSEECSDKVHPKSGRSESVES